MVAAVCLLYWNIRWVPYCSEDLRRLNRAHDWHLDLLLDQGQLQEYVTAVLVFHRPHVLHAGCYGVHHPCDESSRTQEHNDHPRGVDRKSAWSTEPLHGRRPHPLFQLYRYDEDVPLLL